MWTEHGYEELRVPYLVTRESLVGTGQLPKFEEESYLAERDDLWLIPTAEVPVTNLHRDELLGSRGSPPPIHGLLPLLSSGGRGRRKGYPRASSGFTSSTRWNWFASSGPSAPLEALEELTAEAESVLQKLGLAYRVAPAGVRATWASPRA
jgi:seryl-tRNA synthetase